MPLNTCTTAMPSLWPTAVLLVTVLVVYGPRPTEAAITGTLTTAGGSSCGWSAVKMRGSTKRALRLNCNCDDKIYSCRYKFDANDIEEEAADNVYIEMTTQFYSQLAKTVSGEFGHTLKIYNFAVTDLPSVQCEQHCTYACDCSVLSFCLCLPNLYVLIYPPFLQRDSTLARESL